MTRNLKSLERNATKSGTRSARKKVRRLKRNYKRQGCHAPAKRSARTSKRSLREQIFGQRAEKRRKRQAKIDRQTLSKQRNSLLKQTKANRSPKGGNAAILSDGKTARTVCVRTCDGYYFPASFTTKGNGMSGVQQACNALCPGRDMEPFYQTSSPEGAGQMISYLTGQPYSELPKAYSYRAAFDASCSCDYSKAKKPDHENDSNQRPENSALQAKAAGRYVKPLFRGPEDEDPETLANRRGGLSMDDLLSIEDASKTQTKPEKRRIRVIGEAFLPAQ